MDVKLNKMENHNLYDDVRFLLKKWKVKTIYAYVNMDTKAYDIWQSYVLDNLWIFGR